MRSDSEDSLRVRAARPHTAGRRARRGRAAGESALVASVCAFRAVERERDRNGPIQTEHQGRPLVLVRNDRVDSTDASIISDQIGP